MPSLEKLAGAHRQVLTTAQLVRAGFTELDIRRLLRQDRLIRLTRGAYAVPPLDEPMEQALVRGVARLHPDGAISCDSALILHGCPIPYPDAVHVVRTSAQHSADRPDVRLHRTSAPVEIVMVDEIPVVHPASALIGGWVDLRRLDDRRALVCAALVHGVTSPAAIAARQPGRRRLSGARELERTCALVERGCESPPEIDYLLDVEVAQGLPPAQRQVWITLPDGRRRRVDALYARERVIVEVDGAQHWLDALTRSADLVNDAALKAMGYRVVRFTWQDIRERPAWVAAQVRRALALAS